MSYISDLMSFTIEHPPVVAGFYPVEHTFRLWGIMVSREEQKIKLIWECIQSNCNNTHFHWAVYDMAGFDDCMIEARSRAHDLPDPCLAELLTEELNAEYAEVDENHWYGWHGFMDVDDYNHNWMDWQEMDIDDEFLYQIVWCLLIT